MNSLGQFIAKGGHVDVEYHLVQTRDASSDDLSEDKAASLNSVDELLNFDEVQNNSTYSDSDIKEENYTIVTPENVVIAENIVDKDEANHIIKKWLKENNN